MDTISSARTIEKGTSSDRSVRLYLDNPSDLILVIETHPLLRKNNDLAPIFHVFGVGCFFANVLAWYPTY
jgi:hypothetical protein